MICRMTGRGELRITDDLDVTLGDQALGKAGMIGTLPKPVAANGAVYTHRMAQNGVQIALTAAEVSWIVSVRQARPAIETRESILAEIEEYRRLARRAIEVAAEGEAMNYAASERLAAAITRLAKYDAEHPAETAARTAEQDAAHERFVRWN